jgi:hypothetical protein
MIIRLGMILHTKVWINCRTTQQKQEKSEEIRNNFLISVKTCSVIYTLSEVIHR